MLTRLADWLRRRRDDRAAAKAEAVRAEQAVALARAAFSKGYPDRQAQRDRHRVDALEAGHIVTLFDGSARPSRRSWWHIDKAGIVIELPYDKAVLRIHVPIWR